MFLILLLKGYFYILPQQSSLMPKLYALLVGINNYQGTGINSLRRPEKEVDRLHQFLKQNISSSQIGDILPLKGPQAKKATVENSFRIFSQATGEDICLYYFTGHGSRLTCLPYQIAQLERGSLNPYFESTVMYDSRGPNPSYDLADKTLGNLINNAMQGKKWTGTGHFLAILDCCHAGHGTKLEEESVEGTKAVGDFADDVPLSAFTNYRVGDQNYGKILNGPFINIAASREDKRAVDGVFTGQLISDLERIGLDTSYSRLMSSLSKSVKTEQDPVYYTTDKSLENIPFLGGLLR